jgi:SAM-dependent methyltransferase
MPRLYTHVVRLLPFIWKLSEVWRDEGISGILLRIRRYATRSSKPDAFDVAHGTETSVMVDTWNLNAKGPNLRIAVKYQGVNPDVLRLAFRLLPLETLDFPFIDLGCGKGRGLILAHEAGYRNLIGIDFSQKLLDIAKNNLDSCGITADLCHEDADDFVFPHEPCVVYLYNPFGERLVSRIANRIPALSYVIYANPKHRSALARFATLAKHQSLFVGYCGPSGWPGLSADGNSTKTREAQLST